MKYPKYPGMKDSGVEWLGDVPEHWQKKKFKYIASLQYGQSLPAETREEGDVLVFGSNGPVGTHTKANTCAPVIVVGRKGSFGKVSYSFDPVFAIDTTYYLDPRFCKVDLRWLFYTLQCLGLDSFSQDTGVPGLNRVTVYERMLPDICQGEQSAIASFLDRETAKLDALIDKKQRLIALLLEKRQALISHVVTKGLDPNVPMKDSGVEWLGEVPEGWKIMKTNWLFDYIGSGTTPDTKHPEFFDGDIPWVNTGDLNDSYLLDVPKSVTKLALDKHSALKYYPNDTLLVAMYGATIGKLGITTMDVTTNQACCALAKLKPYLDVRYIFYSLLAARPYLLSLAYGGGQPNISQDTIKQFRLAVPDVSVQNAITAFLDRKTAKLDALITKTEQSIELLQEYRQALISAAVTGKIDVRGEV